MKNRTDAQARAEERYAKKRRGVLLSFRMDDTDDVRDLEMLQRLAAQRGEAVGQAAKRILLEGLQRETL